MKYTLINSQGRVRMFFIKEVAELYQIIEGGVILTEDTLATEGSGYAVESV